MYVTTESLQVTALNLTSLVCVVKESKGAFYQVMKIEPLIKLNTIHVVMCFSSKTDS